MTTLRVSNRWTRHGHDRLYIETTAGTKVGWYDLRSGRQQLNAPGLGAEFIRTVQAWKDEHTAAQRSVPARPPKPRTPIRGEDLSERRAGDGVAAIAQQRRPQSRTVRGLARVFGIRTADWSWAAGAEGEIYVGRRLDRLRRGGARVLHSIPLGGGGDIDHLVISAHGIWTVNTKHHRGALVHVGREVRIGTRVTSYASAATREAMRVQNALRRVGLPHVRVRPVIVVHGARQVKGSWWRRPHGVRVLSSSSVPWWWRWRPARRRMSPETVAAVVAAACDPATWASA